jgi:hypothetical protein
MNAAVGPLTTSPPTMGETATTGAAVARSASAIPGTSRIGRIEMTGFDGPMTTARAVAIAWSAAAGGAASAAPSKATSSTGPSPRRRIMNSWNGHHRPPASTRVRTGASAIGTTRAATPSAAVVSAQSSVSDAPSASRRARRSPSARSRSPRLNQTSSPHSRSASMTMKVSPARPQPRSSMRSASQNVTRSGSGET